MGRGSTVDVIRLVGGPPKLDGSLCDLRVSPRDRADADGDQFVRAARGSTITALAALQGRCVDRRSADRLAAEWRALLYRPAPRHSSSRWRPAVYRFAGYYSLEPRRGRTGTWELALCARLAGDGLAAPPPPVDVWAALEQSVDDAASRFARVAALVPDGLHADRVGAAERAVARSVEDASRLCAVGAAVAPSGVGDRTPALTQRIAELVRTVDHATEELVELHLALAPPGEPADAVRGLASGWRMLPP